MNDAGLPPDPDKKPGGVKWTLFLASSVSMAAAAIGLLSLLSTYGCSEDRRNPATGECVRGPSSGGGGGSGWHSYASNDTRSAGWGRTGSSFGGAGGG